MVGQLHKNMFPWEALVWIGGLVVISLPDPTIVRSWSLCVFDLLGITFCPGCGLGHAVAFLVRGELELSLASHPLAIPVVIVLLGRALYLFMIYFRPAFR